MIFISNSEDETKNFAEKIAKNISVGKVIALNGDLGTGKTTFTQGFATAMGISESVGSPTFKLISEYLGEKYWLYHIDAYRLNNANEFLNIGGEDYLFPTNGITLIEWADIISDLLDNNIINIRFSRVEGKQKKRKLEIEGIEFNL
tara:strand:+ start:32 stop:469 length:438 start_codon:yes stop_codon:yes gene_type:complete